MGEEKKVRVLQTIRQGKIGGGESHVLDLVANLDRTVYEPVVLSFTDGPMITALTQMGVRNHVIPTEKPFDLRVWKQVKALLIAEKIDIVHVHGTRANTNVLWAARSLKLPVIYTIHGWSFHDGLPWWNKRLRIVAEQFITRLTNANITVSESNRQTGITSFGKFNATVIPNGVNAVRFNPGAAYPDVRGAYGFKPGELVIGYIVRMTEQKDPLGLLDAFAKVVGTVPDIRLLMVGEGDLKSAAIARAEALGISKKVIFDNFRQDVPAVLNAVDIYCLPSLWEGFPIGVLEAMAMGKAVIATNVDGTQEAVEDGVNGLLVPARDAEALASAIIRLATDAPLRARLQEQAKEKTLREYGIANMTRKIEAVYQEVSA